MKNQNKAYLFAFAAILLWSTVAVPFNYAVPTFGWVAVVYVGIFEMGITFVIWLIAMKLTNRTDNISNYVYLSPFLSLIFIYSILHEKIYFTTFMGLLLIVGSIFLNRYFGKKLQANL